MSDEEKFDAIIIGAGPAGLACAYVLAREGKSVLVIERGAMAGSKNLTGGRLYTYALDLVEPGLHREAALERKVVREKIIMLGEKGATALDYVNYGFDGEVPNSYTVLHAPFTEWFAGKAEEQGVMIACGIRVDELIEENGKITGVKAGEDEMYADVVIAADGVNSFIAQKAGLCEELDPRHVGVGIKEVIDLPAKTIEDRFNLNSGEGAACMFVGCSAGVSGGGFLYTNQDSVSLGLVLNPHALGQQEHRLFDIFQEFKNNPAVAPLIAGGKVSEFGGHLVSEAGWRAVPKKLYRSGLLVIGDAAGFVINTGFSVRGIDLAIVSGVAAAKAILSGEDTAECGSSYMKQLKELCLFETMKVYAGFPDLMENRRMFTTYPVMANRCLEFLFSVDGKVPEKLPKGMLNIVKQHVSFGEMIADAWKGFRSV